MQKVRSLLSLTATGRKQSGAKANWSQRLLKFPRTRRFNGNQVDSQAEGWQLLLSNERQQMCDLQCETLSLQAWPVYHRGLRLWKKQDRIGVELSSFIWLRRSLWCRSIAFGRNRKSRSDDCSENFGVNSKRSGRATDRPPSCFWSEVKDSAQSSSVGWPVSINLCVLFVISQDLALIIKICPAPVMISRQSKQGFQLTLFP